MTFTKPFSHKKFAIAVLSISLGYKENFLSPQTKQEVK
jgi:hypothetical protein